MIVRMSEFSEYRHVHIGAVLLFLGDVQLSATLDSSYFRSPDLQIVTNFENILFF